MLLKSVLLALFLTCTTLGVTIPSELVKREAALTQAIDESADQAVNEAAVDEADGQVAEQAVDDQDEIQAAAARGDLRAFDVSQPQAPFNPKFWKCAVGAGYKKAVIRGYSQSCSSKRLGGAVDSNFVPAYKAARAAGFTNIDAYMFPCTGKQTGKPCKPPQQQLDEFLKVIKDNKINVHRLWFDVEPSNGDCKAWNLSKSANLALAKQWVALLKKTGLKWGIYANGNQWSGMFPSRSSDIGSDLPLWAVQFDNKPGVNTVTTFMGGWKKAMAKQYKLDTTTPKCKGSVDLDSFAE